MNAPLPGAFLLASHEFPMMKEVFIVETLTQLRGWDVMLLN